MKLIVFVSEMIFCIPYVVGLFPENQSISRPFEAVVRKKLISLVISELARNVENG